MTAEPLNSASRQMVQVIVRYLEQHPEAMDTMDGIVQWWFLREEYARRRADVERALDWLLTHDLLLEIRRPGMPPSYRLNP